MFNEQLPRWDNPGTEPPTSKKDEGWIPSEKPPAGWLNWLFNKIYNALKELQEKAETSMGSQEKADAAEAAANEYTDQQVAIVADGVSAVANAFASHEAEYVQQLGNADLLTIDKTLKGALNELFTNANNGKQNWVDVIGSPLLNTDTFSTLKSKTQTLKNTMATNLTNKGQSSVGTDTMNNLVNKIANIALGKRYATGYNQGSSGFFQSPTMSFKPRTMYAYCSNPQAWFYYTDNGYNGGGIQETHYYGNSFGGTHNYNSRITSYSNYFHINNLSFHGVGTWWHWWAIE